MNTTIQWSPLRKVAFCIGFLYALLYILPFPFTFVGVFPEIGSFFIEYFWEVIVQFAGTHLFGTGEISQEPTGSGDTTFDWIHVFCIVVLSVVGGIIWYALASGRTNYERLRHWIMVYITYFLIFTMIVYGMVKVIKLQFSDPSLTRLLQTYGDSSPMGLAWTFMGASDSYTFFAGFSEVLAALLLLFRRTRTLGGIFAFGVMLNVFMMNMSYDIPVKLFSFHLIVFALVIAAQDIRRLLNLFILNRSTEPLKRSEHFKDPRWNKGIAYAKFLGIAAFFAYSTYTGLDASKQYGSAVPLPVFYGIYDVKSFEMNGEELPPLLTETTRWRKLLIDKGDYGVVRSMQDNSTYYAYKVDTLEKTMSLTSFADSTQMYSFDFFETDEGLELNGHFASDTLRIELERVDLSSFELINRGFHWINEYPHNR